MSCSTIRKNISPVEIENNQKYIWYISYENDTVYEYDDELNENIFDALDKNSVSEFGLLGCGNKIRINNKTGVFSFFGQNVRFCLKSNDKTYSTNGRKDIITYKKARDNFNIKTKESKVQILAYYIGYKLKIQEGLYLQIIMRIEKGLFFEIKVSGDFQGSLMIYLNDNNIINKEMHIHANSPAQKIEYKIS